MSTNDSVFVLANGESGTSKLNGVCENSKVFSGVLTEVLVTLAKKIVMDGEGATKFVTIQINNAANDSDARKCTQVVANSLLCKTAWFGGDPNWGRV